MAYGEPITMAVVAAIIGAGATVTKISADAATRNSAKNRELRANNPCVARIDAQLISLKQTKPSGWKKRRSALMKDRKQYVKGKVCASAPQFDTGAGQFQADSAAPMATFQPTTPGGGSSSTAGWAIGGVAVALAVVGIGAALSMKKGKR